MQNRYFWCADWSCSSPRGINVRSRSDEVDAARMGFQESNEAHQRTAQRSLAFEKELENTHRTMDALRSEKAVLKEQVYY